MICKNQLEKTLAKAEETLNLIGYIPLISLISATVRSLGGMLQIILGLLFAMAYFFLWGFTHSRKIKHFLLIKTSFSHAIHGICNAVRAKIEAVPFLSLVLCLPYDRLLKKRFKYEIEKFLDVEVEEITPLH
jgi:Flp pilus assembly protein TadB